MSPAANTAKDARAGNGRQAIELHETNAKRASEGRLVSLEHFKAIHAVDREACEATVGAGDDVFSADDGGIRMA